VEEEGGGRRQWAKCKGMAKNGGQMQNKKMKNIPSHPRPRSSSSPIVGHSFPLLPFQPKTIIQSKNGALTRKAKKWDGPGTSSGPYPFWHNLLLQRVGCLPSHPQLIVNLPPGNSCIPSTSGISSRIWIKNILFYSFPFPSHPFLHNLAIKP
jgi:hypothetical protein